MKHYIRKENFSLTYKAQNIIMIANREREDNNMKDYTKFMKWAVVYMIDRKTQDDRKSKVEVEALFSSVPQAEDNYIIRNPEHRRYIIHVDDLEELETVYNQFQDLREKYGDHAIFHIKDLNLGCDKENMWREILEIYTSIDF